MVEDDSLLLEVIESALESRGFTRAAPAGPAGSASLFRTTPPDGDGIEVLVTTIGASARAAVALDARNEREPGRPLGSLTPRQAEVLRLVALGKTNAEIAEIRGTTVGAVERTIARAFASLGMEADSA